ncbi:MAG: hypothetical protein HZA90_04175 [Verrucomicrobia bacterium]|nr:hypothetical protein [Verrucomicrobiota bacterium]
MKAVKLISGLCLAGWAVLSARAAAPVATPQTVVLEYQELSYPLVNSGWSFSEKASFTKEPAFGKGTVVRSQLRLAGDFNNTFAFAWEKSQARLHIDFNRNGDLTDDADNVFTSGLKGGFQNFTNVPLTVKTPEGGRRILADLNLNSFNQFATYGTVSLRSWWQGKMAMAGREWQVGVVEDLLGPRVSSPAAFLVLRPWEQRSAPLTLASGTADAVKFPKKLFWLDQGFELSRRFEVRDGVGKWLVDFTPTEATLGELNVTGMFLNRLVLETGNGFTVVLDSPKTTVKLPTGHYKLSEVWLKNAAAEAVSTAERTVTIASNKPFALVTGGPLTNSVTASRRGKQLVLDYKLLGVDGPYRMKIVDRSEPPTVAISHGGRQVASGKFAFG